MVIRKLKDFLDSAGVKYVCLSHSPAFTAQEVAQSLHMPGSVLAKTVMVDLDGELAMAVLPATRKVALQELREVTACERVKLAPESQFKERFPDCETGAMPPFGHLYGMDVYVAESLSQNAEIAFNAGSHTEVIKMAYSDFERLAEPKISSFTT